ncbi:hypothetical protein D3C71_1353330 [compost metagenome]
MIAADGGGRGAFFQRAGGVFGFAALRLAARADIAAFDGGAGADQHELVAADAAQHVGRAQSAGQPAGNLLQEHIALLVAVSVVDALEAVQVNHADQHAAAFAQRPLFQPFQFFVHGAAIGQAGQRIGQRVGHQLDIRGLQLLHQDFAFQEIGDDVGEQLQHGLGLRRDLMLLRTGRAQRAKQRAFIRAYRRAHVGLNAQLARGFGIRPAGGDVACAHAPFFQRPLAQRVRPRHRQAFGYLHAAHIAGKAHVLQIGFQVDGGQVGGFQPRHAAQHVQQRAGQLLNRLGLRQ